MVSLAVIGGSGLTEIDQLKIIERIDVETPYGHPSSAIVKGELAGKELFFLPRHGNEHTIPPHKINYRANIWALKKIGVADIIAVAAVGGIRKDIPPEKIVIPKQIVDYTYGRAHTFFENDLSEVTHIDFSYPYCEKLRQKLIHAANSLKIDVYDGGVYGATQGPRLETAAEINRMEKDGCDIVGMTGMPEAALAKELDLNYASCALCVNWAAGKTNEEITMEEIAAVSSTGMDSVKSVLKAFILNST